MRRFFLRIRNALGHERADRELTRELTSHLAFLEDEYRRRGMSPEEARLAARRAMGSVALAKDLHRDARSFVWLDDLRRDVTHTARALSRQPGFTLIAVLALGLGIGVNNTFFTIVNAICLRGLPIEAPERVMYLSARDTQDRPAALSYAEFEDLRATATAFAETAAFTNTIVALGDNREPPARVLGAFISAGGFELLGDRPILGRTFRADEDRPGGRDVVILGAEIWSSRYNSDPSIIGENVTVNGTPSTVIGVMPRGFMFPGNADLWRPMANLPAPVRQSRADRRLAVFARLAPGASEDQARAEMSATGAGWAREFPESNRDVRMHVVPINEQLNPSVAQRAWLAFITAGVLVLLVACANVANLLLMRAATRGREMAIRTSVGATRGRVVRQLLVESAVLAALAGGAGVFLSWAGLRVLSGIVPPETLPYWMAFTMDGRVLGVLLATCLVCVFVCGLPSALHLVRFDLHGTLTESGSTTLTRPVRQTIASLLAAEFALTLVLIVFAVTGVRTNLADRRAEFQIDPTPLVTMWVTLPGDSYRATEARTTFFDRLDERIGAFPTAGSIAFASALPLGGGLQRALEISGRSLGDVPPTVSVVGVSERYFSVFAIPLLRGRAFNAADGRQGSEAAIVNQRFVQMFLTGQDPIGSRIRVGGAETPWVNVVGVAPIVRQQVIGAEPDPVVFLPFRSVPPLTTAIVVRTREEATAPISLLRTEVARLDPGIPLYRVMTFDQTVRNALWNGRLSDVIVKSIAMVALLLALVGLYAVTGHTVQRWTRELGLRIALGAEATQVGWLVLRRVLTQLGIGLGVGIVCVLAIEPVLRDPGSAAARNIRMSDPSALACIVLSLVVVAVAACLVPLRRATRVDPLLVLRAE
jgi:putative ABC transport system permease protein